MKHKLTDMLGYYFVVFQRSLSGNMVKCFIDGDEDYVLFDREYFLSLSQKAGYNPLKHKLSDCLDTTSLYVWDVAENTVDRLYTQSDSSSAVPDNMRHIAQDIVTSRQEDRFSFRLPNNFIKQNGRGGFTLF